MSALNFPQSPLDYQVHAENGRTWVWIPDGGTPRWQICKEPPVSHKNTHCAGGSDPLTPSDIGAPTLEAFTLLAARVAALEALA